MIECFPKDTKKNITIKYIFLRVAVGIQTLNLHI